MTWTPWRCLPRCSAFLLTLWVPMLVSIQVTAPSAQTTDLYAAEDAFAKDFLKDKRRSNLPAELDWAKLPSSIKVGLRYDLRKKYDGRLPAFDMLEVAQKQDLVKTLHERVYVDFLLAKANPGDVGAVVPQPPAMKIELDPKVVESLALVYPFQASVAAHAQELANTASAPLVLSQSGYERSAGYYMLDPKVTDTGPSRRPVVVDPLGFGEAALVLRDPLLSDDNALQVGRCTAVRVAADWFVTARHCVGDPENPDVAVANPKFIIDQRLKTSPSENGRAFVLMQKAKRTDDYASLVKCLTGAGALTITDNDDCPYFVGYITEIEVTPGNTSCVKTVDGPCGMVRPDIALVKVQWKTKPDHDRGAIIVSESGPQLTTRLAKGITFAGYGFSRGADGKLTKRSPLIIGFHSKPVEVDGADILSEYQWTQDLGAGKDGLCNGDSGGPIYAGLIRGHRNTMPHHIVAIMSRITPAAAATPGTTVAASGDRSGELNCYRGKINVVALAPWRDWICQTTGAAAEGCRR
jgi:hypothetical protein